MARPPIEVPADPPTWSRRALLCAGCSAAVAGCASPTSALLPTRHDLGKGSGGSGPPPGPATVPPDSGGPVDSGEPDCAVTPGTAEEGWVALSLDDHPELRRPDGWVWIADSDALLYLLVVCTAPGCWSAVWSTCTHGACQVEWDAEAAEVMCPCHGSRFGTDGRVLQGPATAPLSAYAVGERDGVLWVRRV